MMHSRHYSDPNEYASWRAYKLACITNGTAPGKVIPIPSPEHLQDKDIHKLEAHLQTNNYVIYESELSHWSKESLVSFAENFGLSECDHHLYGVAGVSDIKVSKHTQKGEFIPYTSKRLGWHTDGYYNSGQNWVTSIILHCNQPADEGGMNRIADPDLLYIYLHDQNPEFITALMAEDCLSIPAYDNGAGYIRSASQGPVFWFNSLGYLQMRYTQRQRNIEWSNAPLLTEARDLINEWLAVDSNVLSHKLLAGQGILSNNVLHCRTAFNDNNDQKRHLLRARYLDSIQNQGAICS